MSVKNITIPDLGGAAEVTVIEILVKPGDTVTAETSVVTLESDKATMEVPAGDAGVVKEIKTKVGAQLAAGAVILTLEAAGAKEAAKPAEAKAEAPKAEKVEKSANKSRLVGIMLLNQTCALHLRISAQRVGQ